MPRVNGVYQLLPGVYGVPNEPIASAPYNSQLDDLAKDANDPRPMAAGGTGAQTPGEALTNFGFSAFVKSLVGKASDVLFRAAIGADDATNLTKGTLPAGRISDASHGQLSGGNLHVAATGSTNGFMSSTDKTKLDGLVEKNLTGWVSGRDFTNGTLITTSIPAAVSEGDAFLIEIVGNSYNSLVPFDIKIQGYLYGNAIINHGALSTGRKPTEIWLFNAGGFLCCWLPYMEYWQGYTVFASVVGSNAGDRPARNVVTTITNSAKPAGRTKEVSVSIVQAALSTGAVFKGPVDVSSTSGKALQATTSGADYGIYGRSTNAGYGGVLGYSADLNSFGILGHANAYSLYGAGKLYTSANIEAGGHILANSGYFYGGPNFAVLGPSGTGIVYLRPLGPGNSAGEARVDSSGNLWAYNVIYSGNGASYLHTNGNVYGSAWGGYLSDYISRATVGYVAGLGGDSIGSQVEMVNVSGSTVGVNSVVDGSLLRVCIGDQNGQSTGRQPGGAWRNISTDVANNRSVTFVRAW